MSAASTAGAGAASGGMKSSMMAMIPVMMQAAEDQMIISMVEAFTNVEKAAASGVQSASQKS